jgi:hypothetical protein
MGIPPIRENWLEISYPTGVPDVWGAEVESEVPKMFQLRY